MKFNSSLATVSILLTFSSINANDFVKQEVLGDKIDNIINNNLEVQDKQFDINNKDLFNEYKIVCEKVFKEIDNVLNTKYEITQHACDQLCNLTMGAQMFAEQMALAVKYLITDLPNSKEFKNHAEVFNITLDILNKKIQKNEITTNSFINDRIKLYLSNLKPIIIDNN